MAHINYNHLYYFYVIAREGSMKQASKVLHLTQPTLSDQLRCLEESLGVKLFERKSRKLVLNDYGKIALKYANHIFALGNEFLRILAQKKETEQKITIEIGIVPYLSKVFTFDLLMPIFEIGLFKVRLQEGELKHLINDLALGNIELILSNSKIINPHYGFKNTRISKTRFFAVGSSSMKHAVNHFPKSLNNLPFFHYTEHNPQRDEIDRYFSDVKINPKIIGEADDINFLKIATAENICFSILPEASLKDLSKKDCLTVLGEIKELTSSVWAVTNNSADNSSVHEFIQKLILPQKS